MPLKLGDLFYMPAVVDRSYYDCAMNAAVWKVKDANIYVRNI